MACRAPKSKSPEVSPACGIAPLFPLQTGSSLVACYMEPFTVKMTVDTYSFYMLEELYLDRKRNN